MISDRESDIYEHFARRPANVELLVRSNWNRKIKLNRTKSRDCLRLSMACRKRARFSVTIPAAPGRKERTAELACASRP